MVDVAFDLVYFFEYAQTALDYSADFQADAPRQRSAQRRARVDQRARALDLKPHQGRPSARSFAARDLALGYIETQHLVLRQIDAVFAPIDFHVLPEVDQLQAAADRIRMREVWFGGGVEQMQQQPAYRVGRASAVLHEFGKVRIARLDDVLRKRVEQVVKRLQRQAVSAHDPRQIRK